MPEPTMTNRLLSDEYNEMLPESRPFLFFQRKKASDFELACEKLVNCKETIVRLTPQIKKVEVDVNANYIIEIFMKQLTVFAEVLEMMDGLRDTAIADSRDYHLSVDVSYEIQAKMKEFIGAASANTSRELDEIYKELPENVRKKMNEIDAKIDGMKLVKHFVFRKQ